VFALNWVLDSYPVKQRVFTGAFRHRMISVSDEGVIKRLGREYQKLPRALRRNRRTRRSEFAIDTSTIQCGLSCSRETSHFRFFLQLHAGVASQRSLQPVTDERRWKNCHSMLHSVVVQRVATFDRSFGTILPKDRNVCLGSLLYTCDGEEGGRTKRSPLEESCSLFKQCEDMIEGCVEVVVVSVKPVA
jgi:hypothetical protein